MSCGVAQQLHESRAIAYAGIERREAFRENETILQPVGLGYGKQKNLVWFGRVDA